MKRIMLILALLLVAGVAGCGEEFAVGFGTGAATAKALADDAQERAIEAVNELNAETNKLNANIDAVKSIDVTDFVKPETVEAIKSLQGREKEITLWIALASLLLGGSGVNIYKNQKKQGGE